MTLSPMLPDLIAPETIDALHEAFIAAGEPGWPEADRRMTELVAEAGGDVPPGAQASWEAAFRTFAASALVKHLESLREAS